MSQITRGAENRGRKEVERNAKALEHLTVEYVPVDSIKPNTYNPNRQSDHEFTMLLDSMKDHGFTQPIIVQRATREIVDGFHRWRAGKALGMKEIPVVFVDMTPEQMRIATLSHNRARGSEDIELTAELLRDLEKLGAMPWVQDSLGMDDVEVQRLINDVPAPEVLADADYGQPWKPGNKLSTENIDNTSMTLGAVEEMKKMQERVKRAKSDEERSMAMKDMKVYRVNLMFVQEEAELVQEVLGNDPAQPLLKLCRLVKEKGLQSPIS